MITYPGTQSLVPDAKPLSIILDDNTVILLVRYDPRSQILPAALDETYVTHSKVSYSTRSRPF